MPSMPQEFRPQPAGGRFVAVASIALTLACASGCGTAGTPRGAEAVRGSVAFSGGPAAPTRGLPLPSLDVPWRPPSIVAGDPSELAEVVAAYDVARVVTPPASRVRLDGVRPAEAIAGLSPATRWLPPAAGSIADAIGDVELPLVRTGDSPEGPRYEAGELAVDPGWLTAVAGDADAVVVFDRAPIDVEAWRGLPVASVGTCDEVLDALAVGQEHGLAEVEPFVDHLDALLLEVYRPAVGALAPDWLQQLQPYAGEIDEGDPQAVCGRAYLEHVRNVAACAKREDPDCTLAPRTFLLGGLRIGVPVDEGAPTDASCAQRVGLDYVAATRELAAEAAQAVFGAVDPRWLQLADRVGALSEIYGALEPLCIPQRRRFAHEDLVAARHRLADLGARLSAELPDEEGGHWELGGGPIEVLGSPPILGLAQWNGGPASASEDAVASAHGLARWLSSRALCHADAAAPPWALLVTDRSGHTHLSYAYPEEIACGSLPARR